MSEVREAIVSELPPMRRWYKCIFRTCDYYKLYLGLIGPRLTHNEYHKAAQNALDHLVGCPVCEAKQPCETFAEWQNIWKT